MNKRKTTPSDDQLYALEAHLAGTLKPVRPPREVIQRLRERIRFPQRHEIVSRLRDDWQRMFLVFGGVISGLLIVITVARAFFHLVGRRHM